MNVFSISQLQQYSGIKAHTIRIWEQRYDALQPHRSEGNTRYYDNSQLRRLLNIVSLMGAGYKVSELCKMTDEKLFRILDEQLKNNLPKDETSEHFTTQLIAAGITFDEAHFEKIFSHCLLRFGIKNTYTRVVYPLLLRIGLMWANDTIAPAQEHFISNMLKQKIFSAIDALPPPKSSANSWLLFLPENEFHEIGLLLSYYLIRQAGKKAIYLGSNLPLATLEATVKQISPAHLLFFLVHQNMPEEIQSYLRFLKKKFRNTKIHLAGNEKLIRHLKTGKEINWIQSVDELERHVS